MVEKIATTRRGQPITLYDSQGDFLGFKTAFYCLASFEEGLTAPLVTSRGGGVVGVDLNADHLAVCESDASGNPIYNFSLPYNLTGKSSQQRQAILNDYIADLCDYAHSKKKSIAYEDLDFSGKKQDLREKGKGPYYNQMLSQFFYKKYKLALQSRAKKIGIELLPVNPAFTSLLGAYKFDGYQHLSFHECAALAIARRSQGLSERPKVRRHARLPARIAGQGLGSASDFERVRKSRHVWSFWRYHSKSLRERLTCYHREFLSGRHRDLAERSSSQRVAGRIGGLVNPGRPSGLMAMVGFLCDNHGLLPPTEFFSRLAAWRGAPLSQARGA